MQRATGLVGLLLPTLLSLFGTSALGQDLAPEDCLDCHDVDQTAYAASVHVAAELTCLDCHADRGVLPHDDIAESVRCADCHDDVQEDFDRGIHSAVRDELFASAGGCPTCHGVHDVRAVDDEDSPTHGAHIAETCGQCHRDRAVADDHHIDVRVVDFYEASVHGVRNQEGIHAATCTACHGAHLTLRANDPESKVNPFRIVETCGECHVREATDYELSIHGRAFERGVTAAPVCTDCHGFHRILETPEVVETRREGRSARHSCPVCHSSDALMGEFGIPVTRVSSYEDSYHGLALSRGGEEVADCASCHGVHDIRPASDPQSRVAPWNLEATCGGCHENANAQFTQAPVHYSEDQAVATTGVTVTRWVRRVYWVLLVGVLGGMLVHNFIVLGWYVRRRWSEERSRPSLRRFGPREIAQHAVLMLTFFLLVVSGFMLAYPGTWWSRIFLNLGLSEGTRQWLHRIPAVALMVTSVYHLGWLTITPRGRRELRRMQPGFDDLRALRDNMAFHLGRTDRHVAFGKFDYPAKAEYWALIWGTFVMVVTGLVLWMPELATQWLPGWAIKVAQVIHLYEAWLATLAILFFHFFYVIGHPESYPLNFAMLTGRIPRDLAEKHHPKWVAEVDARADSPARGPVGTRS